MIRLRLARKAVSTIGNPFTDFDTIVQTRRQEADAFYGAIIPHSLKADDDIISMPDKWEYPWFAAWDLAFHMLPLAIVDSDFAKEQLDLMLRNDYLHPNDQIPAYEWNFGDVNPPVHAYATMQIYLLDKARNDGKGDLDFLKYAFSKLLVNFTWWVNRKDRDGNNVFEGGFLGLDNIGVFDRSSPLPTGGCLGDHGSGIGANHQTGWTGCVATLIQTSGMLTKELIQELLLAPDVEYEFIRRYKR